MTVRLDFLSGWRVAEVYPVFMAAFSDYLLDTSRVTLESFTYRAIKNGVDLDASVGAFKDGELVGFTLIGFDTFDGQSAAYDSATGIIKSARGQGLAGGMLDFARPRLAERGVDLFVLEVLKENAPAIKAYHKAGFSIQRGLDTFQFPLNTLGLQGNRDPSIEFRAVPKGQLGRFADCLDWQPSWEYSLSSLMRFPAEFDTIEARIDGISVGVIVFQPRGKLILSLAVDRSFRRRGIGRRLVAHAAGLVDQQEGALTVINIDNSDSGMVEFLTSLGFEFRFGQHEMRRSLK